MPSGLSLGFSFTGFHSFCNASISEGGGAERAEERDISEAEEAVELERERPSGEPESSGGVGIGTESTSNCPLLKASKRNGFRLSKGASEKSTGPNDFKASWRADMVLAYDPDEPDRSTWNRVKAMADVGVFVSEAVDY
jgi:hypothetical protein